MFYVKLGWLGIIFILLSVIAGFYNTTKQNVKSAWEELDKAESNYPEGKLKEYAESSIKQTMNLATQKSDEGLNYREFASKAPTTSKSFFSELKELFK